MEKSWEKFTNFTVGEMPSYKASEFIEAIKDSGGVISTIADRVGCSRPTVTKYIDEYVTVRTAFEAERNRVTDKARSNVIDAIEEGDLSTSKWWLQVKDAEFVQKSEVDLKSAGKPLTFRVVYEEED